MRQINSATPIQRVYTEQVGVDGRLLKAMASKMGIPAARFFAIIDIPKATAERKASSHQMIAGASGHAALGMARLLGIAQGIVDNSTATEAIGFDAGKWLGRWIEQAQPALGGKAPAELLDTPTGIDIVSQVLGAIESSVYL
ncbi:MAG: antitoxin Xre/MbcA/ParS toxin-binding domain-containing protein [Acidiferrobacter sp.]